MNTPSEIDAQRKQVRQIHIMDDDDNEIGKGMVESTTKLTHVLKSRGISCSYQPSEDEITQTVVLEGKGEVELNRKTIGQYSNSGTCVGIYSSVDTLLNNL